MNNPIKIAAIVLGALLVTGVVKSSPPSEPCMANDKLLDIIKDQQDKLSDMLVESKKEADAAKKKYETLLDDLAKNPCKTK